MSDEELEKYIHKIEPNFDSHIEKGTIEMSNEYYNSLEEWMFRLINKNKQLLEENKELKEKYNLALTLLLEYDMPCEKDDFMNNDIDYCEMNCSVDNEIFKNCWSKFIEDKLKERKGEKNERNDI